VATNIFESRGFDTTDNAFRYRLFSSLLRQGHAWQVVDCERLSAFGELAMDLVSEWCQALQEESALLQHRRAVPDELLAPDLEPAVAVRAFPQVPEQTVSLL